MTDGRLIKKHQVSFVSQDIQVKRSQLTFQSKTFLRCENHLHLAMVRRGTDQGAGTDTLVSTLLTLTNNTAERNPRRWSVLAKTRVYLPVLAVSVVPRSHLAICWYRICSSEVDQSI